MTYIVKDVITAEGVAKKQFYEIQQAQGVEDGVMVDIRVWAGEYSQTELEQQKTVAQANLDLVNTKLAFFTL